MRVDVGIDPYGSVCNHPESRIPNPEPRIPNPEPRIPNLPPNHGHNFFNPLLQQRALVGFDFAYVG